ncbi:type I restriction-modification system subunit M [Akkermansia sp.]|uniref:type I restriction-modification system subunit M n=1 Tax=Akkermansia sp. TaxID=1872421 RepID=UPI0025C09C63|nr:type I restriction-modification system subunit M [Akkermansia sp.]MCD8272254.1 type I restriction-modification system subunit M [Akkermansia sp.]
MNKQQLASKIWESANKMRSKIEANEYKDYILGFIFYKFLSDKEVKFLKENDWTDDDLPHVTEDDAETVDYIRSNVGYFISYKHLFSTWIDKGSDFSAADVTEALSAFSRMINPSHKKVFDKVFATLETGLSKLGENSGARTKAIRDLLHLIKDIPMDGRQDYDVLGFIYEYLISNFAANAGKKAGEFYTPHEVSLLMSEIVAAHLKDRQKIKIYDPTSGSGSLLINIGKCVARYMGGGDNIKYYAQELKENTYNLTRMNLVMRGILPNNIVTRNGDTLEEDWPYFDDNDPVNTYDPLYVDAVVSNPPYSQPWNPADKESDPRYRFGLAPKGKADYAFLLHDLYHLKPDGIMTIVLPHGVLFRGGTEGAIRRNLVEGSHIDAIIGLPANIFFGTGIPTIIMVLKQKRQNSDVLIVDASKGFAKVGKNNVLRACDIKKIVDVVSARADVEKFAKVVSLDEIRGNDYNLNIPRYVDSSDKNERWDIFATMFGGIPLSELADFHEYWAAFPHLKDALFTASGEAHCRLNVADLKSSVLTHADVTAFTARYASSFADFEAFLTTRLLDGMETLNITREESIISDDVFSRLNGLPLIDKYKAYQLLDDEWKKISVDLEIIRTEGFASSKQVDPNMVVKTKDGKKQEVQDGWMGHIIPFALVQQTLLAADLARLNAREARLSELAAEYESLLNELSEEDKDKPFVNDEGDAFVPKEIAKAVKSMEAEPETLAVLRKVNALNNEEKSLKKQIKADSTALHLLTKKTIEELTDEQARQMIKLKWIPPLLDSMAGLPSAVIADFIARLLALAGKYETTFTEVDSQIAETESSLVSLLDELTGNEFDMQGIQELKFLLGGSTHE